MIQKNEIPKYLKQKEAISQRAIVNQKHKHNYEESLIQYESTLARKDYIRTSLNIYCTVCGKIADRFKENKSIVKDYIREINSPIKNCKCYSRIPDKELYEKYHDKLAVFFVEDIFIDERVDLKEKWEYGWRINI